MADTTYDVVLRLSTEGSLDAKLNSVENKLGSAHERVKMLQHGFTATGEAIERMADKIIHVGAAMGAMGAAAGIAAAAYGVAHLNDQLEQTEISLAAIFQAQGFSRDFTSGMTLATDQLAKMKKDVKTLPGDLGQLSNIMKMIATPAAQGGMSPDQIRQFAGKTMLVGTILGVQQEVASREMANLLAGRAGSHNILGSRLGLMGEAARRFNAEDPTKRVAELTSLLGRYQGATDRFGQSFIANWTTLKDNIKYGFLADATSPLFDAVKRTMASVNSWFDNNQDRVKSWAMAFGQHFTATWDMAVSEAQKFGPALEHMGHVFFDLWDKALAKVREFEPLLAKVAGFFENLSAQDVTSGMSTVLDMKLAGMGLQAGGSLIGAFGGKTGSAVMGSMGGAGSIAMAMGTLMDAAIVMYGAAQLFHDSTQTVQSNEQKADIVADSQIKAKNAIDHLSGSMDANTAQGLMLTAALENLFISVDKLRPDEPPPPVAAHDQDLANVAMHVIRMAPNEAFGASQQVQKRASPTTNIQKVEIVVKGSDDPSRVARLTLEKLQELGRHPKTSPYTTQWASATATR